MNATEEVIKCSCNNCSEHIEFGSEMLGESITCPHCGLETRLYLPAEPRIPPPKSRTSKVLKASWIILKSRAFAITLLSSMFLAGLAWVIYIFVTRFQNVSPEGAALGVGLAFYLTVLLIGFYILIMWILFPIFVFFALKKMNGHLEAIERNTRNGRP